MSSAISRSSVNIATEASVVPSYYYFTNITFLVEGELFRVHRHHFEQQSEVFRDMFQLPVASGAVADGLSDEQPLRLDGVKRNDFLQLLRVMFPTRLLTEEIFSVPQWTSVLKLSALWQMNELTKVVLGRVKRADAGRPEWIALLDVAVQHQLPEARTIAIQNLSSMFDRKGIEKVLLGRKYKVKTWLRAGLLELKDRQEFFSDAEERQLGWETTFKLCRLREQYLRRNSSHYSDNNVEKEFQSELSRMVDDDREITQAIRPAFIFGVNGIR